MGAVVRIMIDCYLDSRNQVLWLGTYGLVPCPQVVLVVVTKIRWLFRDEGYDQSTSPFIAYYDIVEIDYSFIFV